MRPPVCELVIVTMTVCLPTAFWPRGGAKGGLLPVSYWPAFGSQATVLLQSSVPLFVSHKKSNLYGGGFRRQLSANVARAVNDAGAKPELGVRVTVAVIKVNA